MPLDNAFRCIVNKGDDEDLFLLGSSKELICGSTGEGIRKIWSQFIVIIYKDLEILYQELLYFNLPI